MGGGAMIVKLQGDANDVVALGFQQRSRRRRIDAAGHGDDDPGVLRTAFEIETVEHGSGHWCDRRRHQTLRDQEAIWRIVKKAQERFRESWFALSETAEKLLSNIGRIPERQSRAPLLHEADGKTCRRAEKTPARRPPQP